MSDVIFNPDQMGSFNRLGERGGPESGLITKIVMKLTGIEDEAQANKALLVIAVTCFVLSAAILWKYI